MNTRPDSQDKPGFLRELSQRRVVQAAAVYFAVAWTLTEVLSFLFGAIPVFPEWTRTIVALLFVTGFPVAMFLAWRFDFGKDGIRRTQLGTTTGRLTIAVALVLLAGGTAGLFLLIYPSVQQQTGSQHVGDFDPPPNSIAVMPFLNIGDNPDYEFFAVGLPDTVLHKIANLRDLIVISRTSSFSLAHGEKDAATIGRELNARYLLEGSVQSFGNEIRIIAQLVATPDAAHVWSLDRRVIVDDVFDVQDEIALEIAAALRLSLRDDDRRRLLANGTDSVPAYLEYLRGNYAQQSRSLNLLDGALGHYRAALDIDPDYAHAHVGLARTYRWLAVFGELDEAESRRLALEHVERAIELDDQLGRAYATLAELQADDGGTPDPDLLQRAIALNPNDPEVMRIQAINLCGLDADEACAQRAETLLREAIRRAPENPELHFLLGFRYLMDGAVDNAIRSFNDALRHNPNMTSVYPRMARVLFALRNDTLRSVSCLREAIERDPRNFMPRIELASTYIDIGLDDRAEQLLDDVAAAPGMWGEFRKEILLNLYLVRGEQAAALDIAEHFFDRSVTDHRTTLRLDLIFSDRERRGELPMLLTQLEDLMSGIAEFDREAPAINSTPQSFVAPALIKTYRATGQAARADSLARSLEDYLESFDAAQPVQRGQARMSLAELYLWRGDADAALAELEPLPDDFRYHAWYVEQNPDFAELHGDPRFDAIVERIRAFMRRDRDDLLAADASLPPCIR